MRHAVVDVRAHQTDPIIDSGGSSVRVRGDGAPGSRLVFLAGACPLDSTGATRAPGDHAAQAVAALDNLEAALAEIGASLTDVLATRVLVATADRTDLVTVWNVVADRFGTHDVPSTLLGVTVLGYPDQLVEIESVAACDSNPK